MHKLDCHFQRGQETLKRSRNDDNMQVQNRHINPFNADRLSYRLTTSTSFLAKVKLALGTVRAIPFEHVKLLTQHYL